MIDLGVDVLGLANRKSGGYGALRSAGMGYFFGDGDDSACRSVILTSPKPPNQVTGAITIMQCSASC